ncbi:MAG: hypothetical protein AMS25_11575 [Gemmatimonas sp. SM23_52]|nr:MAG: hypothetical protein AMS25_11575 [Gemmatimonas sp. SM23_52]
MRRRRFLERIGKATIGLGLLTSRTHTRPTRPDASRQLKNWTWVHGRDASHGEWGRRFARLRAAEIHAVLVSGGDTATLAGAAHAEGLEFHRWIWTLNRSGDHWVKENHPEWFSVSRTGDSSLEKPPYVGYYQWLCPTRPEVREYLRGIVERIAGDPAVAGIHLDYIRHPDVILPVGLWSKYDLLQDREYPEFDFCYCEVCRRTFQHESGTDPLALPDPSQDAEWREFRWRSVTDAVRVLAEAVHAHGKPITAAVFPTPALARRLVRQAWDLWPLDAVFPMIYHNFYQEDLAWIGEATREGVAALPAETPLYSGLYLPSLTPAELAHAVHAALQGGASGVSTFEMGSLSDAHLAHFSEAVTR